MNPLKKLAGQTAIYGISSIAGRIFNFLLTPLYTAVFSPRDFGIVSEMYAYVAIILVLVTYGMETSLFNFSRKKENLENVFGTTFLSVLGSSSFFVFISILFADSIANFLRYPDHNEYVIWFAAIIGLDAVASIPLAKLRQLDKAKSFAAINLFNIFVNIGLNVFFLVYCKNAYKSGGADANFWVSNFYNNDIGIGYVFISNLIASIAKTLMLLPTILREKIKFNKILWKEMMIYTLPLAIGGLGFIINEKLDIILLKYLLPENISLEKAGIYAANYKLAIFMSIFIQAFRFAMEPFFFNQAGEKNDRKVYADVLHYFVIFCCFVFLGISLNLDILKHFIRDEAYWIGLDVVPILLMANVFLGIYVTMSMWYKLSGETKFGAYFSILGALITIVINVVLIPHIHYYGSAIATLCCYFIISLVSYQMGQKHFPVPYQPKKVFIWILSASILFGAFYFFNTKFDSVLLSWILRIAIILIFTSIVLKTNPEILRLINKRKAL